SLRLNPFENLECYTSLMRSQLGGSLQGPSYPVTSNTESSILPISVRARSTFLVAISLGSGAPSSTQVTSDSSVQKEQFKINNITSPSVPSNYKQKDIPASYEITWRNKVKEYQYAENDSDADSNIDKVRWQFKIRKEKSNPPAAQYLYDLAGNAYLQEKNNRVDPRENIAVTILQEENSKDISDIFNYYYEEEIQNKIFII
ncbi:6890_t:CDS:2, partial [Gigaspora rosea]